jgi:hypothetical protein
MAKEKTTAVGKAAKTPTVKQLTAQIRSDKARETTLKHDAATAKTAVSRKHDLAQAASIGKKVTSLKHERATKEKPAKSKTGLALHPDDVQCCAAQALAASLRLALGVSVHDEDMLALYWRTAGDPDEGASIRATLEAAHEHGIGGHFPAGWQPARGLDLERSVLLRLDLPEGPHAVTTAPDGSWWSWGEPYDPASFPGAVITDAWAVNWS